MDCVSPQSAYEHLSRSSKSAHRLYPPSALRATLRVLNLAFSSLFPPLRFRDFADVPPAEWLLHLPHTGVAASDGSFNEQRNTTGANRCPSQ